MGQINSFKLTSNCALALALIGLSCAEIPEEDLNNAPTDSNGNSEEGVVVDNVFWVRAFNDQNSLYFEHKEARPLDAAPKTSTGGFDQACQIDLTQPYTDATHDIFCVIEVPERDLHYLGVKLQYNVPPNTSCSWLNRSAPVYNVLQPGSGSGRTITYFAVEGNIQNVGVFPDQGLAAATPKFSPFPDPAVVPAAGAVVFTGGGGPYSPTANCAGTPCATNGPVHIWDAEGNLQCAYDYSVGSAGNEAFGDGPNCCSGTYDLMVYNYTEPVTGPSGSPGAWVLDSSRNQDWGGDQGSCRSGAGTFTPFDEFSGITNFVEGTGINEVYEVPKLAVGGAGNPSAKDTIGNVYTANYFADGSPPSSMINRYYDFSCVDRADELVGRIRVLIREWDSLSQMTNFQSNGSGNADSGTAIFDPGPCTPDPNFPSDCLNDRSSWRDFQDATHTTMNSCLGSGIGPMTINPTHPLDYPGFCE